MRFMVLVKSTPESESGALPDPVAFAEMDKFTEELVKAGVMLAGEGLQPSSKGARVRFAGNKATVIDGPFAEAKELIAGFMILQVKSKEEALEWVKRAPFQDGEVEVRQLFDLTDFAPLDPTGELLAKDHRVPAAQAAVEAARREQAAAQQKK